MTITGYVTGTDQPGSADDIVIVERARTSFDRISGDRTAFAASI